MAKDKKGRDPGQDMRSALNPLTFSPAREETYLLTSLCLPCVSGHSWHLHTGGASFPS